MMEKIEGIGEYLTANMKHELRLRRVDQFAMAHARIEASKSKCVRKQVGAVATTFDGRILASGYNGTAAGEVNCCDHFAGGVPDRMVHRDWSDQHEIHAEMNLIIFAARHGISLLGCSLYCTLQPCWQCLKALGQLGIARLVYDIPHSRNAGTSREWADYCVRRSIGVRCLSETPELGMAGMPSYVSSHRMPDGRLVRQVEQGSRPTPFEPGLEWQD